jgi:glucokinase
LALPALQPEDLLQIGGGAARPDSVKIAVGPGTGLGVGAIVPAGGAEDGVWVPVPGEGGHVTFGPVEPDEYPVWSHITPEQGRISAEVVLSGRGIVALYRAVAMAAGATPALETPAEVTGAALADTDPLAVRTLRLYARLLGRLAGDVTLTFMARGGAYVGGGIAPRILPFLQQGDFRRAFEQKAPHAAVMAEIPAFVIIADNPALHGLAAFARNPGRFGVNLSGRHWRR